jgi:hypothetical protein
MCIDSYGSLLPSASGTEYLSPQLNMSILTFLQHIGVKIHIFNHTSSTKIFNWQNITNWKRYSERNHNKNFIFNIKGIKGLVIGDCQWANEHFSENFICNNVAIISNDIFQASKSYFKNLALHDTTSHPYYYSAQQSLHFRVYTKTLMNYRAFHPKDNIFEEFEYNTAQFYFNEISPKNYKIRKTLQCLEKYILENTKTEAIYTTPYFCPDLDLQKTLLINKAKIKVLIGKYHHCPYIFAGVRYALKKLLPHNLKIYCYSGNGNLHYKDLISDATSFIKTSNGEGRSRYFNQESGIIIESKKYADFNRLKIENDLKSSNQIYKVDSSRERVFFIDMLLPLFYHHL